MKTPVLSSSFVEQLQRILPSDGYTFEQDERTEYGKDRTKVFQPAAAAVVFPRTTQDVVNIVKLCSDHHVAMVPSGGRTGLAGGAVASNGELVISLEKMRTMGAADELGQTLRVQAGAITEAVHQHCAPYGLTWPVDFASKGSSQVGGNIATNAGGLKVIRYGLTRQWVLGLEVVLANGDVLNIHGSLEKNNTGFDLRQLFIGSEGTLGIITEATLKLTRLPEKLDLMVFGVPDIAGVLQVFQRARKSPLIISAFEFFSDKCLSRVQKHRGWGAILESNAPYYVLIETESSPPDLLQSWLETLFHDNLIVDGTMAQSRSQSARLWGYRESISESLASTGYPHKNDVSLPIASLQSFCHDLEALFSKLYPDFEICLYGHIGDGNLHINVMKPDSMPKDEFLKKTHESDYHLFELVQTYRGSISAEHGVGLLKKDFLRYCRSNEELATLRAIKRVLDPKNLMNPGKIFD